jgi:pyridoxal 5'-phosphate synthase pdxT subunit
LPNSSSRLPFHSIFIRAPVVEKILPHVEGEQVAEALNGETVVAPSKKPKDATARAHMTDEVEVLARLPGRAKALEEKGLIARDVGEDGDIIAVRQGNCFGTSFHPELTGDARIHIWWLHEVLQQLGGR